MNPLVSAAWVAERLGAPGVVLLDATLPPVGVVPKVDTRARYGERHLPGAVFFDVEALSETETALPHMLPSAERFGAEMAALGVGDADTLVVYEQGDVFSAPRAWWTLRMFGAAEVRVLDGGLRAWVEAGLPVEAGEVRREAAGFHARAPGAGVCDLPQVQQMLGEGAQVVDARSAGRFSGAEPEPRAGLRSGHMPGALNVPYTELTSGGRMLPAEQMRAVFEAHGVDWRRPVTTTCGSGVTAAVVALALEICGAEDVTLYDGSWAEYAATPGAVIEGGLR